MGRRIVNQPWPEIATVHGDDIQVIFTDDTTRQILLPIDPLLCLDGAAQSKANLRHGDAPNVERICYLKVRDLVRPRSPPRRYAFKPKSSTPCFHLEVGADAGSFD